MGIKLKNKHEIELMRQGGKILAEIMRILSKEVKPGVSTGDLDKLAAALCQKYQVTPAFKGYRGYPAILCTGVNDVAVHGIPSNNEILRNGQILSIDMGIIYQGYFSDHAVTVPIGKLDADGYRLLNTTQLALDAAIKNAKVGNSVGDLGYAMEQVARLGGFNVIRMMVGHGIGKNLHEDPEVPCFGERATGERLQAGMVLAIEAMVNEGTAEIVMEEDGWTTKTADGKRSAIFEHTVLIGENPEILTI